MIDFTIHRFKIPWKLGQVQYLLPFGDVHEGSPAHHKEKWNEFLKWAESKKDAYFIGMGDYFDLMSTSENKKIKQACLHDSTLETLDEIYNEQVLRFFNRIRFMKGKLLGLLEGNHHSEFQDGTTSTQRLCILLGCKYLGWSSLIRMSFVEKERSLTKLDIYAHHGKGGASKQVGASVNHVQSMNQVADAQIYLMGHDHAKIVGMSDKLYLTDGNGHLNIRPQKVVYARTGSFLKGYDPEKSSYVARGIMRPSNIGAIKIELTCKNKSVGSYERNYADIHVSL